MKHSSSWLVVCLAASCTYNEYNVRNEIITAEDAGATPIIGAGGASNGPSNSAAGSSAQAGSGLVGAGASDSVATDPDCSGCVRIRMSGATAEYQLEFDSRRNLATSLVLWRVRVRGEIGVGLQAYVESGEHNDGAGNGPGSSPAEATAVRAFVQFDPGSGWQDVGIDLQPIDSFRAASIQDAGGGAAGGASFDPGFQFDKSRVRRVGLAIAPATPAGVFTPATLEIDSVTFSNQQSLSVDFSANAGDFELLDPESAVVTHVPE